MVSPVAAYAAAFFLGVLVFTGAIVWVSLRGEAHTPPPLRSDDGGDDGEQGDAADSERQATGDG